MRVVTFKWRSDRLDVLDQRQLPHKIKVIACRTPQDVAEAIRSMAVRGAPAIGCVAAYGMALAAQEMNGSGPFPTLQRAGRLLKNARPTAVNLAWAVDKMLNLAVSKPPKSSLFPFLLQEAQRIEKEDLSVNRSMSLHGAKLLPKNSIVLTHCNAGALATAGIGTALGIIRAGFAQGRVQKVFVDETRPYLQGSRLTAWELLQEKIPHELITDSMAGFFMSREKIAAVLVGCDRVAANGDTANKIGTYSLGVLAKYHHIPFYVAMPTSTLDLKIKSGRDIPIENRSSEEVVNVQNVRIAPLETKARHPAFDVTPASLITAIVTEFGVIYPPFKKNLKRLRTESTRTKN